MSQWGQGQQEHSWSLHSRLCSVPRIQQAGCLLCQSRGTWARWLHGAGLPEHGTARHSPAGPRGCGRMLPDRGQRGTAQGHQGRLLPPWSAGLCQPGGQWDES